MMLSDAKARRIKVGDRPLSVGGVRGLMLFPTASNGRGRFQYRYTSSVTSTRRSMGVGTYPEISLAAARRAAHEAASLNACGRDPIDERRAPAPKTFADFAQDAHDSDLEAVFGGQLLQQTVKERRKTLDRFVLQNERFSSVPIAELTSRDFAELLEPYWLERHALADRIRQLCKRVVRRAVATGTASLEPLECVGELLPARPPYRDRVRHHPSMDRKNVEAFIRSIGPLASATVEQRALVFIILTGCRPGEGKRMRWGEFKRTTHSWCIPAHRMKNRREHVVPLSRQCLDILEIQESEYGGNELVFATITGGAPSDLRKLLVGRPSDTISRSPTVHGFRATLMQWGAETEEDERLIDRCLSHDDKTRVERAYNRSSVLQRRRELLQRWADYVAPTGFGGTFS